jgi:hypothetical protein
VNSSQNRLQQFVTVSLVEDSDMAAGGICSAKQLAIRTLLPMSPVSTASTAARAAAPAAPATP